VADVYDRLTDGMTRFRRARDLVYAAADAYPGLVPTEAAVIAERDRAQRDKSGIEIDQGIFLAHVLAQPVAGRHLMHAMRRPLPEAESRLDEFRRTGRADLGAWRADRQGNVGVLTNQNTRYLNAEDDESNRRVEVGVDLLLLDDQVEVCVLRGGPVDHPKHAGRRVFSSGLNLTALYYGRISVVDFMIERELGLNNKMYRGLSTAGFRLNDFEEGVEKPFIAAVEGWAIGGGCQWLLIMDHVIAERGAYFNLPARKEGIVPGLANLRLPRFVGDRLARQAIFFNRDFSADSPDGRMLCDQVVDAAGMDRAIEDACREITSAGITSLTANRRMLRQGQETLEQHRLYMANYAREQAYAMYSDGLIANLERNWNAREKRLKDAPADAGGAVPAKPGHGPATTG
jgi:(3,5-dihydroxyphenyl)acetyl-CoA 1,2-dioxygenase